MLWSCSYIKLIVNELETLQNGVFMTNYRNETVLVKVCCTHIAGDLPAIRKVCCSKKLFNCNQSPIHFYYQVLGFASHNAYMGCNYCLTPFPQKKVKRHGEEKNVMDYSAVDVDNFEKRTKNTYLEASKLYQNAPNATVRDQIKKDHGTLKSEFLRLSYFDPITMGGIDIMHLIMNGRWL